LGKRTTMSIVGYKRATIVLGIAAILLIALCVSLLVDYAPLTLRLAMASEQVKIFEEMRSRAVETGPSEAIGFLSYAASYYPSGSKQVAGCRLDRMVEQARASAVREIIADLRQKTGEDLGTNAQAWIDKYGAGD
jgi:hypothetical protein